MTPSHQRLAGILASCAATSMVVLGCASDEKLLVTKVAFELEACKRAEGSTHEVKFEVGSPYIIQKSLCDAPITNVRITEKINGNADVGPYDFQLRKNISDQRWLITRVTWPELDQARSIQGLDSPSKSDLETADTLLAKAEEAAPTFEEIKVMRLTLLLKRRKETNKNNEPLDQRATLGLAKDYYQKAIAATKTQKNANLELQLRLLVLDYYRRYHQAAVDSSEPSVYAQETDEAVVKAIRHEAKEAKKKKDDDTYKKKMAEADEREKLNVKAQESRVKDAAQMKTLADTLKTRFCTEIKTAQGMTGVDNDDLKTELGGYAGVVSCP